jgi:hypothetical protein
LGDFKNEEIKSPATRDWGGYCINGITSGYLKSSPFGALTLAIITQITFRVPSTIIIGIPIMMKHKGIVRTM